MTQQGAYYLPSSRVSMSMQYATARMGRLLGKQQLPVLCVELCAPLDQLHYVTRALFDKHAHGRFVAQPRTRHKCVLQVLSYLILFTEDHRHAALRIFSIRFRQTILREHDNSRAALTQTDSRPQS